MQEKNHLEQVVGGEIYDALKIQYHTFTVTYNVLSLGLEKDVNYTDNGFTFSRKNYVGSWGFLRNYDGDKDIYVEISNLHKEKFHRFIELRKNVTINC
jgi:cold shock CspA family protein